MTIETLKNQLAKKFRGASLDDIQGLENFLLFSEAATNLLSEIDPDETVRLHRFNQFGGIYQYASPDDLKGKKVIDPRPQDERNGEEFSQTFRKEFDREKKWRWGKVQVGFEDGIKILSLSESGKSSLNVDVTYDNDGWTAAGGATNLEIDSNLELNGLDTLRVDLGATGGYIENSTLDAVDLSEFTSGSFFRKIYIPSGASTLTSVTLRIGSASGAYYSLTGTPQIGSYREGVNLVRFDWEGVAPTGSPDEEAIDYERLTFVTTAVMSDVRIGGLSVKLPTPYETPYYSNRLFRSTSGTWLEAPTAVDDEIILEKEAENLFFYECCKLVAEDLSRDTEAVKFEKKLHGTPGEDDDGGLYGQYRRDNPAEGLRVQTRYLDLRARKNKRSVRNW